MSSASICVGRGFARTFAGRIARLEVGAALAQWAEQKGLSLYTKSTGSAQLRDSDSSALSASRIEDCCNWFAEAH